MPQRTDGKIRFGLAVYIGHVLPNDQTEAIESEKLADDTVQKLFPNHNIERKVLQDIWRPPYPFTSTQQRAYVYVLVLKGSVQKNVVPTTTLENKTKGETQILRKRVTSMIPGFFSRLAQRKRNRSLNNEISFHYDYDSE
ncbi:hypothetical protein IPJ63_02515 [Candidatus Nomurabacteria bacterium]|nr:MAG: hypothetical protein IPJ63_02515 [Candidatus Nomurabacteria bacterium]